MENTWIDCLRHGEPQGGRCYRGSGTDDPLSELGWSQMWRAVGEQGPWDLVVTSPLLRCRRFAEALAQRNQRPLRVEPALREVGLGAWEGLRPDQVRSRDPQGYDRFYRDPVRCRPAGAESLESLSQRVSQAYDDLVQRHAGQHLLLVVHAGVIRALAGEILRADPVRWYRLRIDYAHFMRVREDAYGPVIEGFNLPHLP